MFGCSVRWPHLLCLLCTVIPVYILKLASKTAEEGVLYRSRLIADRGAGPRDVSCDAFPPAPFYRRGRYEDPEYTRDFPLNDTFLASLEAPGSFVRMLPVLRKLATGGEVRIVCLGGSMTAGALCVQGNLTWKECAWPARFLEWLRLAFPSAQIRFENLAHGGMTSPVTLAGIGVALAVDDQSPDLVILDTLVNDAMEGRRWMATLEVRANNFSTPDIVSTAYEKLIRSIATLHPSAAIMSVFAGCPRCHEGKPAQENVSSFYHLPILDIHAMIQRAPSLWTGSGRIHGGHPTWKTHQFYADALAQLLGKTWHDHCREAAVGHALHWTPLSLKESWHTPAILDRFSACLHPLSQYSAYTAIHAAEGAGPEVIKGNWTLYEDRPGKPGWISEVAGSILRFHVSFGKVPRLTVVFLRSYEGMADANLVVNKVAVKLNGLWGPGHENVSQSYAVNLAADETMTQRDAQADEGMNGFGVKPNSSEETLDVVLMPSPRGTPPGQKLKFKLISVLSC